MECSNKNCKYYRKATAKNVEHYKPRRRMFDMMVYPNLNTYGGCKFGYCKLNTSRNR